ncbi:hypothetical protein [Mucilaginibacter sp.]|uniref:hypothetical protein n=1 Tax=Mucilaginibacter sp. TaxID=1882438 RepID=UPI002ED10DA6
MPSLKVGLKIEDYLCMAHLFVPKFILNVTAVTPALSTMPGSPGPVVIIPAK